MGAIKPEELDRFLHIPVRIGIQDLEGEERAPFIEQTIFKVGVCPDGTHLRIFFNERNFLAVPLHAEVAKSDNEWSACDIHSGLNYTIRKGNLLP